MSAARGEPFAVGHARGVKFGALPREIENALPRWIETQRVDGGEELRAGRVWRSDAWVVKFDGVERPLRRSSALRAARAALELSARGVATPAPVAALEWRTGARVAGSVLVTEFVRGRALFDVWSSDPRAVDAFPLFLHALHAAGVYHGDFHPENALWDGARWVLIDLESLKRRAPWRSWSSIAETQWARVLRALDFDARTAELFTRYDTLADPAHDANARRAAWSRIECAARALPPIPAAKLAEIRARLRG